VRATFGILLLAVTGAIPVIAQQSASSGAASEKPPSTALSGQQLASQVPVARPEDVRSIGSMLQAIYDVISGPVGERDWNRLRSLFLPQARFTRTGKDARGAVQVEPANVEEFIVEARQVFLKESFYENEIASQVQTYGNIAQVFSSYESRHAPGEKPFNRGINSIQMINDGKRWWVLSILWDDERPDNPLPRNFAQSARRK
jgi:hypothetical protein